MANVSAQTERDRIRARLDLEVGTLALGKSVPVALAYPSSYRAGMSSLGFQTLYRILNDPEVGGVGAHRVFLPDEWEPASLPWPAPKCPIVSYEGDRVLSSYRVIGISVAYELEIAGVVRLLEGAGIPLLARDRGPHDPVIVAGGPLTNSNPSCLLPFVDLLVAGEAESLLPELVGRVLDATGRIQGIDAAAELDHVIRGELEPGHFESLPVMAIAPRAFLPARSAITTPDTELSNMFLIEPERGCSRRCTFCVMRGATTGGMRLLDADEVLSFVPDHAKKVGLVGAAVTDHPNLEHLVGALVDSGRGVGISSLRADRLTPEFLRNLSRGGYRSITVASDGISERMRTVLDRKVEAADLIRAAELVAAQNFHHLKVYEMMGAPTETDEDVEELIAFALELRSIVRLTLTFSTFVAKRNTPLDGTPFVGVKIAEARLRRIQKALRGKVEIRPQPPKWAEIEYELAQRGPEAGYAAIEAVHAGGSYGAWKQAFADLPPTTRAPVYGDEARRAGRTGKARRDRLPVVG